jgi:hypothetical protein
MKRRVRGCWITITTFKLLKKSSYDGPLVLHSLSEEQVPGCVAFLREKMAQE